MKHIIRNKSELFTNKIFEDTFMSFECIQTIGQINKKNVNRKFVENYYGFTQTQVIFDWKEANFKIFSELPNSSEIMQIMKRRFALATDFHN